jgi:hypothetical protein
MGRVTQKHLDLLATTWSLVGAIFFLTQKGLRALRHSDAHSMYGPNVWPGLINRRSRPRSALVRIDNVRPPKSIDKL